MSQNDIRWVQRFQNFQKAFLLLRDALDCDSKINHCLYSIIIFLVLDEPNKT